MARTKVKTIELFQFADCNVAQIQSEYIKMHGVSHQLSLHHKILFLTHLIIYTARRNKDNVVHVNSKCLKMVIGDNYTNILSCLESLNLISISSEYVIKEHCRDISVSDWNICTISSSNVKVMDYLVRWSKLVERMRDEYYAYLDILNEIIPHHVLLRKSLDEELKNNYNDSLSRLTLNKTKEEVFKYIEEEIPNQNTHRYNYYVSSIENFISNSTIITVDSTHRIYHSLTNLPRDLRRFFNIKFVVDVANSHPLIFSYFLIDKLKISLDILKVIYNINIERGEYKGECHIVADIIRKELINNGVMYQGEIDILVYIYVVSKGWLWDDFQVMSGLSREDVKKKCFMEIFYHPKDIAHHTEFGRAFIERYPNVYQMIAEIKHKQLNLAKMLMLKESELIQKVLYVCHKNGYKVISIHDAVVVLDVHENDNLEPINIRQAINAIYKQSMLHPSTHTEIY